MSTQYEQQAQAFLTTHGIKFTCKPGNGKAPAWNDGDNTEHGNHYRVTLSKTGKRITFDFWGSIADARAGLRTERPYSVLACLSSDATCPETFDDFCGDYGYDTDSRKAYRDFKRCAAFGKRLRAFFTEAEIEALAEIR